MPLFLFHLYALCSMLYYLEKGAIAPFSMKTYPSPYERTLSRLYPVEGRS
jgi:hypothetical protein